MRNCLNRQPHICEPWTPIREPVLSELLDQVPQRGGNFPQSGAGGEVNYILDIFLQEAL